jgi:hypothetical protein
VILWFAGGSFALVWAVFKSPALDYRLVMLGAVVPVVELAFGGPRVLHTLVCSVAALTIVMLVTRRRRLVRRRWLGIPIGLFMHLVLDGMWTRTEVFWWPLFGWTFPAGELPEIERGVLTVLLELAGAAALAWCWQRFRLNEPRRRAEFLRTGHLGRDLVGPGHTEPTC